MIEGRTQRPLLRVRENRQSPSYNLIRSHLISIWALWAVIIRVTDIRFVEKSQLLSLQ